MPEVAARNFANFYLGDNVFELADGVVPEMARQVGFDLGDEPGAAELGALIGVLGKDKVMRNNVPVNVHPGVMGGLVAAAGTQLPMDRSLWTIEVPVNGGEAAVVAEGAVAGWQLRTLELLRERAKYGLVPRKLYLPTGNALMQGPTDVTNKAVKQFQASHEGQFPRQHEFAEEFIVPAAEEAGFDVELLPYETGNGDEIADAFVKDRPELFVPGVQLVFARVANAGVMLACEMRAAARRTPEAANYDGDKNSPQVKIITDGHPVGFTRKQNAVPKVYQSSYTGGRMVGVTAKLLHLAGGGK